MIFGIGIDLVEIARIKRALNKFGGTFANKILSEEELLEYNQSNQKEVSLAKYFSAKEAMAKALGTGFQHHIKFEDIMLFHESNGQPTIVCKGEALKLLTVNKVSNISVSCTDESDYAAATVILET